MAGHAIHMKYKILHQKLSSFDKCHENFSTAAEFLPCKTPEGV